MTNLLELQQSALLDELAAFICDNLQVSIEDIRTKNLRGRPKFARTIFTLAATDTGVRKMEVARWLRMDPSFVTQTRNRHYKQRETTAYDTATRWLVRRLRVEVPEDVKVG